LPEGEHIEKPSYNPHPLFLAPQWTRDVALHKPVTLSDPNPINEGRLIDAKGVVGRYVRSHSQGSTHTGLNRWTELEAYGLPAE
jgi:hypothetical protein